MFSSQRSTSVYIVQRLGLWYSLYRLILACSLILVFFSTYNQLKSSYEYPMLYLYTAMIYFAIALLQSIFMRFVAVGSSKHLVFIFWVDVVVLSLLTYSLREGANLQISLIYMITVFISAVLLERKFSLAITLLAIISITYQNLFDLSFGTDNLRSFGNHILLAFLFFVMYNIGRIAIDRFHLLEKTNIYQSTRLDQLQKINQYILQQIDIGYIVLNTHFDIVVSNPMACQLLALPTLASYEKYPLNVWHVELNEYFKQQGLFENFEEFVTKNNQLLFSCKRSGYQMNIRINTLSTPTEQFILLMLQDTREIHQQVQQLKLAALGQLSASIAHEIRNPLSAIVQANELMRDELPEDSRMLSDMIKKQSDRINQIIHSTLNMARHEGTHPSDIDINQFIEQVVQEDLADAKSSIQLELAPKSCLYFDINQLRQILVNLIRNALRHNDPDYPVIVRTQHHDLHLWIDVIDFGQGVKRQNQHNLFKPFFSTEINGTGLGLYLSHSFCEANQAKLLYVEETGQGACFRIKGLKCKCEHC